MSQKVKGQPSCNSLVALYFWQNIFTPLNHRCIQSCKKMTDDDWKTSRTSKDKKGIGKGQKRMLSDRALCLCHFFVNSASISAPYMHFVIKVWWTFYVLEYSLSIASIFFYIYSTRKVRYHVNHVFPSNQPTEVLLHWTWFKVGNTTQ